MGWALGFMLSLSNMLPAESLGMMKALPPAPWIGILFIFIAILLFALVYLVLTTFKKMRPGEGKV